MKDDSLREFVDIPDKSFPVKIFSRHIDEDPGIIFDSHWHDKIEFLYFSQGEAVIECNKKPINAKPGDMVVVNSNELHRGLFVSGPLSVYCIIMDISFIQGSYTGACETKYIIPIRQNGIIFKNKIEKNETVANCINRIFKEFDEKNIGYELSIKASIYNLIVLLLRHYVDDLLTVKEYQARIKNLKKFNRIFEYIDFNYKEDISTQEISEMANMSIYHFCRTFKNITGRTFIEYINQVRLDKAAALLKDTDMNITDIAMSVGYNDANYFSRLFKRYYKVSPKEFRNTTHFNNI
ncbi:MAG: AraC family transcriptional regulator [Firmicutes bacterium]|nr:AraC family transcriptional regulator [Bacillota bacterium]